MDEVYRIMKRLRGKKGCPWDRKQTFDSMKRCVLEEAHEIIDAVDSKKTSRMEEEIGDMMCVVGLLAAIAEDKRLFSLKSITKRAVHKMISRHPHVFGKERAKSPEDALKFFQKIKEKERAHKKESLFDDLGKSLPALMAAGKIQKKVSRVGFDWPDAAPVMDKIDEELSEIRQALKEGKKAQVKEEIGDFLFSVVNLARKLGVEGETALLHANQKFMKRFLKMEDIARKRGIDLQHEKVDLSQLDRLWNLAKAKKTTSR